MASLIPYPPSSIRFDCKDDIIKATQDGPVAKVVQGLSRTYHIVDPRETKKDLNQVSALLHLAFAGSKNLNCSTPILGLQTQFQNFIGSCSVASSKFVTTSLEALKRHLTVISLADQKKYAAAVNILISCADLAGQMADKAEEMFKHSKALCDQSEEALLAAVKDDNLSTQQKKEIEKALADVKAKEASLSSLKKDLEDEIEEAKKEELRHREEADGAETRSLIISIISTVMAPVVTIGATIVKKVFIDEQASEDISKALEVMMKQKKDLAHELKVLQLSLGNKRQLLATKKEEEKAELITEITDLEELIKRKSAEIQEQAQGIEKLQEKFDKKADTARAQEIKKAEEGAALRKERRACNAELAQSLSKLGSLKQEESDISTAIMALEITIKTLGKVKTVFAHTRLFWEGVQNHCKALVDVKMFSILADTDCHAELEKEIKYSGLNWLTIGKLNLLAYDSMEEARMGVDHNVSHIPGKKEARALVSSLPKELITELQDNEKALDGDQ